MTQAPITQTTRRLKPWSALSQDERIRLQADYQSVLDCETGTCSFAMKLSRMQQWLAERGISITEDEIRRPPPR